MRSYKKRLVIDARIIETSTGLYMQRLVHFLHIIAPDEFEYVVLVPSEHQEKWQKKLPSFSVQAANQKWYTFAEQWSFFWQLRALKPDLVHFTMPQQPFLWTRPAVTTIHDTTLIHFDNIDDMHPTVYAIKKAIFKSLVRIVIARARRIIVPTEYVKRDLTKFMKDSYSNKMTVTLEAGEPVDESPEVIPVLKGNRYFFFIGNAFPYKNIKRTILAYQEYKKSHPDIHLALAGKKEFFYEQLEDFVRSENVPDVHFLGRITDGEKRWAFAHADAFVTASYSEGFHIPILEAFYEKCPVIASNASCLPEVAGDGALYFDPSSTNQLVEQMETLQDPVIRQTLIDNGQQQVKKFSWEKLARETLAIYRQEIR